VATPSGTAGEPEVEELPPVAAAADGHVAAADEPVAPERTEPLGDAEEAAAAQAIETAEPTEAAEGDRSA
jgi:hypothetical protein